MNAPTLFIYIPFIFGALEFFFAEKRKLIAVLSLLICFFLIGVSASVPINSMIIYGENSLIYTSSVDLFGRTLALERSQQPILSFFYAVAAIGILLSLAIPSSRFFVPAALTTTAMVVTVIAVKPFIFGAMMVFLATLMMLPLLWNERRGTGDGLLRLVFWQLMGMILLSLGAWLATLVDINPTNQGLMLRVTLILFLGLAFWLGFFPTHSWIGMVLEESCPFISGFLVTLLQFASLYILLNFMNSFIWVRMNATFLIGLKNLGMIMMILGGIETLTERSFQRVQSAVYLAENGVALMLLGFRTSESLTIFFSLLFIRVLSGIFWAMANKSYLSGERAREAGVGAGPNRPATVFMMILAYFSITGFPFLASFPLKVSFLSLSFSESETIGGLASVGSLLLTIGGCRYAYGLMSRLRRSIPAANGDGTQGDGTDERESADEKPPDEESRGLKFALYGGGAFLISILLYPELLNAFLVGIRNHFSLIVGG